MTIDPIENDADLHSKIQLVVALYVLSDSQICIYFRRLGPRLDYYI